MNDQTATYCPEDNKLRLYVGRVPRDEYEKLRAQGWTSTPKQTCQFVATWTPDREDTALAYSGGILEDEDQSPQDRAADRAERFEGYREKRTDEATGTADRYEAGPQVHGYQSQALAERRAASLDRVGGRAVNLWEKAEYWQRRTAGVIDHALYVSGPGVRMGRIKTLEAELRKHEAGRAEHRAHYQGWLKVSEMAGAETLLPIGADGYAEISAMNPAQLLAYKLANDGGYRLGLKHPDGGEINANAERIHGQFWGGFSAYDFLAHEKYGGGPFRRLSPKEYADLYLKKARNPDEYGKRWADHYRLRLAYENQMLDAQGGRAAFVEMEAGGWIGKHQIQKVNKSPATGRVVSVQVWGTRRGYTRESGYSIEETRPALLTLNIERLKTDVYRAPTDEERAAFEAGKKEAKAARGVIPTINPTTEDAQRLQAQMNAEAARTDKGRNYPRKPGEIDEMTQAEYSGSCPDYKVVREYRGFKLRLRLKYGHYVESVVVLTDKPQKPLPASAWDQAEPEQPATEQQELAI